jgi:Xaa-Pro aminopeptidase
MTVPIAGSDAAARAAADRVDAARLRGHRREACLSAMAGAGLDALVLGREANARYVSDARRLWTAGARPFGPGCVVVAATGAVHLLSSWDDGVPPEIDHDHLYGVTWNGGVLAAALAAIPGLAVAARIGVDGMTPGTARLLAAVAPGADVEDATGLLDGLRRVKAPDEQDAVRVAVAIAESTLLHALGGLRPGVAARHLTGRVAERMAALGATIPDLEGAFWATSPPGGPAGRGLRGPGGGRVPAGSPVSPGELPAGSLVASHVGAMVAGYEGVVARTWVNAPAGTDRPEPTAAHRRLHDRWAALWEELTAACRAGASGDDLLGAYERAGEPLPAGPVAHGVGLGMEPPMVGAGLPADAGRTTELVPGTVLFVVGQVTEPAVGTVVAGDTLLVTGDGPERLGSLGYGPLAGEA